jgi:RNA polymerase sigma-70 factor (ECF subfamily)
MIDETDESSDEVLVRKALSGDNAAFATLFDRHYEMIYAFAYKMCLNFHNAEDVAQETFIKAAQSLASLQSGFFKAWIHKIASNLVRDVFRKRARSLVAPLDPEAFSAELAPSFCGVREALDKLSFDLRQAVVLVFMEGMSHSEAGKILGCAESTVSWRLFVAKRKLRDLLAMEYSA